MHTTTAESEIIRSARRRVTIGVAVLLFLGGLGIVLESGLPSDLANTATIVFALGMAFAIMRVVRCSKLVLILTLLSVAGYLVAQAVDISENFESIRDVPVLGSGSEWNGRLNSVAFTIGTVLILAATLFAVAETGMGRIADARYRLLAEHVSDVIWITDLNFNVEYVSPSVTRLRGYTPEEMRALSPEEGMTPESLVRAKKALSDQLNLHLRGERRPNDFDTNEFEMTCKDGSTVWVETNTRFLFDEDNHPTGVLGISRDISERRKLDRSLRESKSRVEAILNAQPDLMFCLNQDGVHVDFYAHDSADLLVRPDQIVGSHVRDVLPPDAAAAYLQGLDRVFETKEMQTFEYQLTFQDRGTRDYEARMVLQDANLALVTIRDVTDRKRADEALRRTNANLRLLQRVTATANTAMTLEPAAQAILDRMCEHLEWPLGHMWFADRESMPHLSSLRIWHVEDGETYDDFIRTTERTVLGEGNGPIRRVLDTRGPAWFVDLTDRDDFIRRDAAKRAGLRTAAAFPVMVGNDAVAVLEFFTTERVEPDESLLGIMRDIGVQLGRVVERQRAQEERQEIETRAQQSQKLESLGVLAGGIAHDFNNILQAVIGYTDLALEDLPANSNSHAALIPLREAADRARRLVKQILAFSRKTDMERRIVDPAVIVEEALELVRASLPSTIEIRRDLSEQCGPIFADSTQIHQVIVNLCTNAYHAMSETGGILDVQLGTVDSIPGEHQLGDATPGDGAFVRLCVRDTGSGMDDETLARIFEPFFTTKALSEGTGLGMAMVHGIVHGHGGTIAVESEVGVGTTITVYLPVATTEVSATSGDGRKRSGTGERILLVDDEEALARVGKRGLERSGYEVHAFTSSADALAAFRASPNDYDAVVTDQTMPGMTGRELAAEITQINPEIPVILLSGFVDVTERELVSDAGIRRILMKPVSIPDLSESIQFALNRAVPASSSE